MSSSSWSFEYLCASHLDLAHCSGRSNYISFVGELSIAMCSVNAVSSTSIVSRYSNHYKNVVYGTSVV